MAEDCQLCQTHGNPLAEAAEEFELAGPATGPVKPAPTSVADRLAALLAESEEESGSEAESEDLEVAAEEDYEDEE